MSSDDTGRPSPAQRKRSSRARKALDTPSETSGREQLQGETGQSVTNVTNFSDFTPSLKQVSYLNKYMEELELPRPNLSNLHLGSASKVAVRTIFNWLNGTAPAYEDFRVWFVAQLQSGIDIKRVSTTYRAAVLAERGSVAHLRTLWSDEVTGRVTGGIQGPGDVSIKIMVPRPDYSKLVEDNIAAEAPPPVDITPHVKPRDVLMETYGKKGKR